MIGGARARFRVVDRICRISVRCKSEDGGCEDVVPSVRLRTKAEIA